MTRSEYEQRRFEFCRRGKDLPQSKLDESMVYSCGCTRRPKDQWTREPTYYEKKPYGYATRHLDQYLRMAWGPIHLPEGEPA